MTQSFSRVPAHSEPGIDLVSAPPTQGWLPATLDGRVLPLPMLLQAAAMIHPPPPTHYTAQVADKQTNTNLW